jgi:excisionase family DNA binding protein
MYTNTNQLNAADRRPPNSFTPLEIAEKLGVKQSTVYAWLSRKELHANKVGNRRFISSMQLKAFTDQRTTGEYIDYTYANGPK